MTVLRSSLRHETVLIRAREFVHAGYCVVFGCCQRREAVGCRQRRQCKVRIALVVSRIENQAVLLQARCAYADAYYRLVCQVLQRFRVERARAYRHSIIASAYREARARCHRIQIKRQVARYAELVRLLVEREQRVRIVCGQEAFGVRARERVRVFVFAGFRQPQRMHGVRGDLQRVCKRKAVLARVICRKAQRRVRLQLVAIKE